MGISVGGAPAYAHIRRLFERGEPLTDWHRGVLMQANAAALRELHLVEMRAELEDEEAR